MKNVIVADNFYSDPLLVRNFALTKCEYLKSTEIPENFAGIETKKSFYSEEIVKKIESLVGEQIMFDPKKYSFGVFSKTFLRDEKNRSIHVDSSDWTAIVYLSRPEDCQGGTTIYENKSLGISKIPTHNELAKYGVSSRQEFIEQYLNPIAKEYSKWKASVSISMKFNRIVILRSGELFHAANNYFGTDDNNCRLMQLFFFNLKGNHVYEFNCYR